MRIVIKMAIESDDLDHRLEISGMKCTYHDADEAWKHLRDTINNYQVALFLGAGVSTPNRMPSWREFIQALGGWNDVQMQRFANARMSMISLCEIAKRSCEPKQWSGRVRSALYENFLKQIEKTATKIPKLSRSDFSSKDIYARYRVSQFFEATNPVLWDLVSACGTLGGDGRNKRSDNVGALLTTNVDGLPQLCDRAVHTSRMIRTVERASTELNVEKIPMYQLHGYLLPPDSRVNGRGEAADGLVLTEDEYVARTDGPYAWANVTLHFIMREMPVVFIGCSMTDDLIRRALFRSTRERAQSRFLSDARAVADERTLRRHFAVIRLDDDDEVNRIRNIDSAMMGIWPLWVTDYREDLRRRVRETVQSTGQ